MSVKARRLPYSLTAWLPAALLSVGCTTAPPLPNTNSIDSIVETQRTAAAIPGIALAVIEQGQVHYVQAYGLRDVENGLPLATDTVVYGASLTKLLFAAYLAGFAQAGELDFDTPVERYLSRPLPAYEDYADLTGDERWRNLTLRNLLAHTTGFANYRFFPPEGGFDPDGKLRFFFDPDERYGYSGEGYYIAQLVAEEALGIATGPGMQQRVFEPLGMTRTSLTWREDFRGNLTAGYTAEGENRGHNRRSNARAAGSMDTTIEDMARWTAAFVRGELPSLQGRDDLLTPYRDITSRTQFPTLDPITDPRNRAAGLAAGTGMVLWQSPYGPGFFKGGHNDTTDNILVCLVKLQRCVVLMSNTAKGHLAFPNIVEALLGPTGLPWRWEYSALDGN